VRQTLFALASTHGAPRDVIVAEAARRLGAASEEVERALFADLRSEQRVGPVPPALREGGLSEQVNLAMVAGLLGRARVVRITTPGESKSLVRQARRSGLLCLVERRAAAAPPEHRQRTSLHISGPFALFRQTRIYGRALAALMTSVASLPSFELRAECQLSNGGELVSLRVRSGDPLPALAEPRLAERRVEQELARALAKFARDWEVIREPEPLRLGEQLVFPDFELRHRHAPERRWLLEIVGFWTGDYLASQLARLEAHGISNLLLCIDEQRGCGEDGAPVSAAVVAYRGRIDARALLARLEAGTS
jgi:predicted nuclease of restriction endonuclease-like RecB superfamily